MTPARSLAASVVALGFASALTAPPPAFAAPAPCEKAENYAAQSGAELLRVERLEVRAAGAEHPVAPAREQQERDPVDATDRILGHNATPLDPTDETGEDSDTLSEGIGMLGEAVLDSVVPGGADTLTAPEASGDMISELLPVNALGSTLPTSSRMTNVSRVTNASRVTSASRMTNSAVPVGVESVAGRDLSAARGDENDEDKATVMRGVGLGESRTALVGLARVKSAAVARILDGAADGKAAWTEPILQQAPPSHARAATRGTPAGRIGPLRIGAGEVSAHARWDAGMACGSTAGEAARSAATVRGASILGSGDGALVRVPEKVGTVTTTALERRGETARTVASATVTAGRIELAGGKVRVRVLRPPALTASMSVRGGEVRYRPALIEVSGEGIATKRLAAVGDDVEVTLGPDREALEAGTLGLGEVGPGLPLPLPSIPGLPQVGTSVLGQTPASPATESAPTDKSTSEGQQTGEGQPTGGGKAKAGGTKVRISLGGVRQAHQGNAIAARATAIRVAVVRSVPAGDRSKTGYVGKPSAAISLDLAFGLMEAAAVAPKTTVLQGTSGTAGGLPITGPQVTGLALGGLALLVAGIAAVALGVRRRRSRP